MPSQSNTGVSSNKRLVNTSLVAPELVFTTSRSSGPGGQNVNKVNSKVTVKFDVKASQLLTEDEKELLLRKLSSKITTDGVLIVSSQDKRSQLQNKEEVIVKLDLLLKKAFVKRKTRKATKPTATSVQKRIQSKKKNSDKKKMRKAQFE